MSYVRDLIHLIAPAKHCEFALSILEPSMRITGFRRLTPPTPYHRDGSFDFGFGTIRNPLGPSSLPFFLLRAAPHKRRMMKKSKN